MAIRSLGFWLLLAVSVSCAVPTEPAPRPSVQVVRVSYPPSLTPLVNQFQECATNFSETAIFLEELAGYNPDFKTYDIILWEGEPPSSGLFSVLLGQEHIRIVVHPDNPAQVLSDSEIRSLLSGDLTSWDEAGVHLGQVSVWIYPPEDQIQQVFTAAFMQGADYSAFARLAPDPAAMIEAVSANPGAIGLLSDLWDQRSLKNIPLPDPVSLPVLALTSREPEGVVRELLACVQAPD